MPQDVTAGWVYLTCHLEHMNQRIKGWPEPLISEVRSIQANPQDFRIVKARPGPKYLGEFLESANTFLNTHKTTLVPSLNSRSPVALSCREKPECKVSIIAHPLQSIG